jgi:hypothetical protein
MRTLALVLVSLTLLTAACVEGDASTALDSPAAANVPVEPVATHEAALFQNGCSMFPADWVMRIGTLFLLDPDAAFNGPCNRHDNCYHSGLTTYGKTRSQCDKDLYADAIRVCRDWYDRWWEVFQLASCKKAAWVVYQGVDTFGGAYYHGKVCTGGQTIETEDQAATGKDIFNNAILGGVGTSSVECSTYEPYEGVPTAAAVRSKEMIDDLEAIYPGRGGDVFNDYMNRNVFNASFRNWIGTGNECEQYISGQDPRWGCSYEFLYNPSPNSDWARVPSYYRAYTSNRYFFTDVDCGNGTVQRLPYIVDYGAHDVFYNLVRTTFPDRFQQNLARMLTDVRPPQGLCYTPSYPNSMSGTVPRLFPDGLSNWATRGILEYGNHADWDALGNWYAVWKDEIGKRRAARAAADLQRAHEAERVVFDPAVYLQIYPALGNAIGWNETAARQHWIDHGIAEGRAGSLVFDARYYLERYPDVANAYGASNFKGAQDHWLTWGMREGRASSPVFDVGYYSQVIQGMEGGDAYGGAAYGGGGPGGGYMASVQHYFDTGLTACLPSSPTFDAGAYLRWNPDVASYCSNGCACATQHYLTYGRYEGRRALP